MLSCGLEFYVDIGVHTRDICWCLLNYSPRFHIFSNLFDDDFLSVYNVDSRFSWFCIETDSIYSISCVRCVRRSDFGVIYTLASPILIEKSFVIFSPFRLSSTTIIFHWRFFHLYHSFLHKFPFSLHSKFIGFWFLIWDLFASL